MKRCRPIVLAHAKPSSTIWAAVNTSRELLGRSRASIAWWSADSRSRKRHRQAFLVGELVPVAIEQARDVLVGDRVVLARLHARLALAELRAADADELEDAPAEERALAPHHAPGASIIKLLRVVGEDLQRHRRRVDAVGAAVVDDGTRFGGQLIGGDRFDDGHGDDHSLHARRVRAAACTLTLLLLMVTTIEPAPAATASATVCRRFSPVTDQSATLNDGVLNEVSGVAASRLHPPLLWVHNDSGGEPAVYAIRPDGTLVSTVTIEGATNTDWEDIAVGPGPARGVSYLFLGDIGDNLSGRDHITVYRIPEPRTTIAAIPSPAPRPSRCGTPTTPSTRSRCSSTPGAATSSSSTRSTRVPSGVCSERRSARWSTAPT